MPLAVDEGVGTRAERLSRLATPRGSGVRRPWVRESWRREEVADVAVLGFEGYMRDISVTKKQTAENWLTHCDRAAEPWYLRPQSMLSQTDTA